MLSLSLLTVLLSSLAGIQEAPQEGPPKTEATREHQWLQKLAGEWSFESVALPRQGAPAFEMTGTEKVRALGDLWVVSDVQMNCSGTTLNALMTVGYDPKKKAFVGTWIDSVYAHLWSYRGSLDAEGKVLTLEAEGPSFEDPEKTASYRDVLELKGPDHKVLTSSVKDAEGNWTPFMRGEYRRKK